MTKIKMTNRDDSMYAMSDLYSKSKLDRAKISDRENYSGLKAKMEETRIKYNELQDEAQNNTSNLQNTDNEDDNNRISAQQKILDSTVNNSVATLKTARIN